MAKILEEHWQATFTKQHTWKKKREVWLKEEGERKNSLKQMLEKIDPDRWEVKQEHVDKAIRISGNSAPGPDGIPYTAWRRAGLLGRGALFEAIKELMHEQGLTKLREAYAGGSDKVHDFNDAAMVFLPKKPVGIVEGKPVYDANNTRPLSIVNTENRLMASAVRLAMEPILDGVISPEQRGFIRGRSMLANIVEVEHEMMRYALKYNRAAAIMFDFSAAFPSLDHDYMFSVLEDIGIPSGLIRFIKSLYDQQTGYITLGAGKGEVRMTAGMRQGCPLSPLIFALVSDLLLRRLMHLFPTNNFKAYADDLCMISSDVYRDIDKITSVFEDFGCISGLHLNFAKTQVVPLWMEDQKEIQKKLGLLHFKWYGAKVDSSAEYLGFRVGPGKGESPWTKALNKYLQRAREWGKVGLSLHYSVKVYNTYILPVLSFIAQLEDIPSNFAKMEKKAMAALIPGPNSWIDPDAIKSLHRGYGMPCEARDLVTIASATKLRVAANENKINGGLRMQERRHDIYLEIDRARGREEWKMELTAWENGSRTRTRRRCGGRWKSYTAKELQFPNSGRRQRRNRRGAKGNGTTERLVCRRRQ